MDVAGEYVEPVLCDFGPTSRKAPHRRPSLEMSTAWSAVTYTAALPCDIPSGGSGGGYHAISHCCPAVVTDQAKASSAMCTGSRCRPEG
jgi:hypothetical protein